MTARTHTCTRLVAAAALALSCRGDPLREQPAAPGPAVELVVDGGPPHRVVVPAPLALTSVVEPTIDRWIAVIGHAGSRQLELEAPATMYANATLRLYPVGPAVGLGVFVEAAPDLPPDVARIVARPQVSLADVTRVEIFTRMPDLPPLALELDGAASNVTSAQLRALPVQSMKKLRGQGWRVSDVVALGTSLDTVETVTFVVGPRSLVLTRRDLEDPAKTMLLKANQRGEYVVRVWEGGGRSPTHELRGVTKVVIARTRGNPPPAVRP